MSSAITERPGSNSGGGKSSDSSDQREITAFVELIVTISQAIKNHETKVWNVQVNQGELSVHQGNTDEGINRLRAKLEADIPWGLERAFRGF